MILLMDSRGEHYVKADYVTRDYFRHYNKTHKYKLKPKQYSKIVSELNKFVMEDLIKTNNEFSLPFRTGSFQIVKVKKGLKMIDGKIVNTSPPDWRATMKLWKEDPEAKADKLLIKHRNMHTGGYVYYINYSRYNANYKNQTAMTFVFARDFKRGLAKRINDYSEDKYNATEIKKNYEQR